MSTYSTGLRAQEILRLPLVMQWLRFPASTAGGGTGSNPGQGTKTQHAMWHGQKFFKKKFSQPPDEDEDEEPESQERSGDSSNIT